MREQREKTKIIIPTPCLPTHILISINHLSPIPSPSSLTMPMNMDFLVEMKQSNKCGSVSNYEIFNLHVGYGAGF